MHRRLRSGLHHRATMAAMLVALGISKAFALEGLQYVLAYQCEPLRVTRALVEHCMSAQPQLEAEFPNLLGEWVKRNGSAIETLNADCQAQMKSFPRTDASILSKRIAALNNETIELKIAEIHRRPDTCRSMLSELASGVADLDGSALSQQH